jgi:hypothetical protein
VELHNLLTEFKFPRRNRGGVSGFALYDLSASLPIPQKDCDGLPSDSQSTFRGKSLLFQPADDICDVDADPLQSVELWGVAGVGLPASTWISTATGYPSEFAPFFCCRLSVANDATKHSTLRIVTFYWWQTPTIGDTPLGVGIIPFLRS